MQAQQTNSTNYVAPNAPSSRSFVTTGRFALGSRNTERFYPYSSSMMICGIIGIVIGICCFIGVPVIASSSDSMDGPTPVLPILGFAAVICLFISTVILCVGCNARRMHSYYGQLPSEVPVVAPPPGMQPYNNQPLPGQPYNQPYGQPVMNTMGAPPYSQYGQPGYGYPGQMMVGGSAVQVTHNFTPAGYQPRPGQPQPPVPNPDAVPPPPYNEGFKVPEKS